MDSESKSGVRTDVMADMSEPPSWWREESDVTSVAFTEDGEFSVCAVDDVDFAALNVLEMLQKYYDFPRGRFPVASVALSDSSSR